MAEYEALIFGLSATLSLGVRQLEGHFLFLDATYGLWLCAYWSRLFFRRTTYLKIGSCHRAYGRLILAKIWWYAGMSMERRWRQGWWPLILVGLTGARLVDFGEKSLDLTFIGCVWQWPCWRHCLKYRWSFSLGENLWSGLCWLGHGNHGVLLCHVLPEDVAYGEPQSWF